MTPFNTPILLILYKRHASLMAQMDILKTLRPAKLYAFADGPAQDNEKEDCRRARAVLDAMDWPCSVRTKFMDTNLGCGKGPAAAMDWFFENEPEGIILEDDLLPHPDFFRFCAELLEHYRDDSRVMEISGTNRLGQWGNGTLGYCFSQWGSECGWATWRRAWRHFDFTVRAWASPESKALIRQIYRRPVRVLFFSRMLDRTFAGNPPVAWWDYQWALAKNLNHGLAIVPARTLVQNVGCDSHSTHDRDDTHTFASLKPLPGISFPLRHPDLVCPDRAYDEALFEQAMPLRHLLSSFLPPGLKRQLKRVFLHAGERTP